MEIKIIEKEAFTVAGLKYTGKNQNNEIPLLWDKMEPRWFDIKHAANSDLSYGVCGNMKPDGDFDYIAGLSVTSIAGQPDDISAISIPAQSYAVFPCTIPTIGQTYQYAFDTWIAEAGYEHIQSPDFECYDQNFDPGDKENSILHIYIPIRKI